MITTSDLPRQEQCLQLPITGLATALRELAIEASREEAATHRVAHVVRYAMVQMLAAMPVEHAEELVDGILRAGVAYWASMTPGTTMAARDQAITEVYRLVVAAAREHYRYAASAVRADGQRPSAARPADYQPRHRLGTEPVAGPGPDATVRMPAVAAGAA